MRKIMIVSLCFIIIFTSGCKITQTPITANSYDMGTYITQTIYGKNCSAEIIQQITSLENDLISWRIEDSQLYNLNNGISGDISGIYDYISQCIKIANDSNGAFNPAILPVTKLWDFGGKNQRLPKEDEIKSALKFTDYKKISITNEKIIMPDNMQIELGAVGKGIACDKARQICKDSGTDGAVISVGGSIMLHGNKPDGNKWTVSIRNPKGNSSDELGRLILDGGVTVSTSGDYEKTFEVDGKKYHHILNPETGYPADSGLHSVTIIHENGLISDALSTACFVLGYDEGIKLAQLYNAQAVFVDYNNNIYITDGIKDSFELISSDYTIKS